MCDVRDCLNKKDSTLFHSPLDSNQLAKWKSVLKLEADVFFVCSAHFDNTCILNNNTLKNSAVPTLFINGDDDDCCQSCQRIFRGANKPMKHVISSGYKDLFIDFVGLELFDGFICTTCTNALLSFDRFRRVIRESLTKLRQSQSLTTNVKIKNEDELVDTEFLITEIKTEPEEFHNDTLEFAPLDPTPIKIPKPLVRKPLLKISLPSDQPQPVPPSQGYKCQYCDNRFIERAFVLEHIRQRHTFKCPVNDCPCSFPFKISLIKHQMSVHGPSSVQELRNVKRNFSNFRHECKTCKLKFIDEKTLHSHVTLKHDVMENKLKLGSQIIVKHFKVEGKSEVNLTMKSFWEENQVKELSQVAILDQATGRYLIKNAVGSSNVSINSTRSASKIASNQSQISRIFAKPPQKPSTKPTQHISVLVNKIRKPESIEKEKKTPTKQILVDPQENDPNGIPCLDCGLCLQPDHLLHHRHKFHNKTSESKLFSCDLCGVDVTGKSSLIKHFNSFHLPMATQTCQICKAPFECRLTLIKHINKMHSRGERFICHFCEKVFKNAQLMTEHRKAHYDYKKKNKKLQEKFKNNAC